MSPRRLKGYSCTSQFHRKTPITRAALKGPWNQAQIEAFLYNSTIPLRLSCMGGDGFPRVVSVWYGYDGQNLRCVSHRSSQLVGLLRRSDRVGFELAPNEPPYYGVRGQGIATLDSDADGTALRQMLERYLGGTTSKLASWLLSRAEDEVLISIEPVRLFSWDYRERMRNG
jgi:nitroimidazol reductase NimA-like FMN-containing flavoprotein (pyridoxamine 5'-phosphate oxidase superfamily)